MSNQPDRVNSGFIGLSIQRIPDNSSEENLKYHVTDLIKSHARNGDLDRAEELATDAVVKYPQHLPLLLARADCARKGENYQLALERYMHVLSLSPSNEWGLLFSAICHTLVGNNKQAELLISKAREAHTDFYQLYEKHHTTHLIKSHIRSNNIAQAEELTTDALTKYPDYLPLLLALGDCARKEQNYQLAIDRYTHVLSISPLNEWGLVFNAICLAHSGNHTQAENLLLKAHEQHPDLYLISDTWARLANLQGDWTLAVERWKSVLKMFPDNPECQTNLLCAYFQLGNYARCLVLVDVMDEETKYSERVVRIYYRSLLNRGMNDEGESVLSEVLLKTKIPRSQLYRLAGISLQFQKNESAWAIYEKILRAQPRDIKALIGQARISITRHRFGSAVVLAKKAKKQQKRSKNKKHCNKINEILATANYKLNKYSEAVPYANALVKSNNCKNLAQAILLEAAKDKENHRYVADSLVALARDKKTDPILLNRSAGVVSLLGDHEKAKELYQMLIDSAQENPDPYFSYLKITALKDSIEDVENQIALIKTIFPNRKDIYFEQIKIYLDRSMLRSARDLLGEVIQNHPCDSQFLEGMKIRYFIGTQNYLKSISICEKYLLSNPNDLYVKTVHLLSLLNTSRNEEAISLVFNEINNKNLIENHHYQWISGIVLTSSSGSQLKSYIESTGVENCLSIVDKVLMSFERHGLHHEANQFLKSVLNIQTKASPYYLLSRFEKYRVTSLHSLSDGSDLTELKYLDEEHAASMAKDIKKYIRNNTSNASDLRQCHQTHNRLLQRLSSRFELSALNTYSSSYDAFVVANDLRKAIINKQPYMLIRLSDGEGMFLPYGKNEKMYQASDQDYIQNIWWGQSHLNGNDDPTVRDFRDSIEEADWVGVPDLHRLFGSLHIFSNMGSVNGPLHRGFLGVNQYIDDISKENVEFSSKKLTSCFVHHHLAHWGLYKYVLEPAASCSLITCHTGLADKVRSMYDVKIGSVYIIPEEKAHREKICTTSDTAFYPDKYNELVQTITVTEPGEVFLVAAGFLGKILCRNIKRKGGIAIDVGSIADYWLSHSTRMEVNTVIDGDRFKLWEHNFKEIPNKHIDVQQHQLDCRNKAAPDDNNTPLVSVIMPSYNYAWCIDKAIDSILAQTYENWELIVVEDGSTDSTVSVLKKYLKKHKRRIKYVTHEDKKNRGLAESYKLGVNHSSGEYIAFLECDDQWDKRFLDEKIQILSKHDDVVVAYNNVALFGSHTNLHNLIPAVEKWIMSIGQLDQPYDAEQLFTNNTYIPTFSCAVVRKSVLKPEYFKVKYEAWMDWYLWAVLAGKGKFYFQTEKLTKWQRHNDSYENRFKKELQQQGLEDSTKESIREDILSLSKRVEKNLTTDLAETYSTKRNGNVNQDLIVVAVGRSGTNYFFECLNKQNGGALFWEMFNIDYDWQNCPAPVRDELSKHLGYSLTNSANAESFAEKARRDPSKYLDIVSQVTNTVGYKFLALKVFPHQINKGQLQQFLLRKNSKVIFIVRRRLDAYISLMKAQRVGKWHTVNTSDLKVTVNYDEFINYYKMIDDWYARAQRILSEAGIRYTVYTYENDINRSMQSLVEKQYFDIKSFGIDLEHTSYTEGVTSRLFTKQDTIENPFERIEDGETLRTQLEKNNMMDYAFSKPLLSTQLDFSHKKLQLEASDA